MQPLVENAIKYGVEAHSNAGRVVIASHKDGGSLWLSVRDDGPVYMAPSARKGSGVGIANVRSWLTQLYGDMHSFDVSDADGGGTQVTIRIPFALLKAEPARAEESRDSVGAIQIHDERLSSRVGMNHSLDLEGTPTATSMEGR